MKTFKDRQKAFESKFAFDEEMSFKIQARTNKFLGEWAAEQLGLTGENASKYTLEVIKSDFEEPGQEDVIRKLSKDLEGIQSDKEIRIKVKELFNEAIQQINSEVGSN